MSPVSKKRRKGRETGPRPEAVYWHGASQPIEVGARVLPAAMFSARSSVQVQDYDPSRVYVTTRKDLARAWVSRRPRGALLRVRPIGELVADPDVPGVGFSAAGATVVKIEQYPVTMSADTARREFARLDPSRFDSQGFIDPDSSPDFMKDLKECGLTAEHCRKFGRWANPHRVCYDPTANEFVYGDDSNLAQGQLFHHLVTVGGHTEERARGVLRNAAALISAEVANEDRAPGWY